MDGIIETPRLRLSLIKGAERDSDELRWLHEIRSDEKATWWSINRRSESLEDTERVIQNFLPTDIREQKSYRVAYAVHEVAPENEIKQEPGLENTRFIGLVTLVSMERGGLPLPDHLALAVAISKDTLSLEVAYSFLPSAWSKGFATEAVEAVYGQCKKQDAFWAPYKNVYVRAIVNDENSASSRVMLKTGMTEIGIYEWTDEKPVFLAGKWTTYSKLHIFGRQIL